MTACHISTAAKIIKDVCCAIALKEIIHEKCKVPNYLKEDQAHPLISYCMIEYTSCTTGSKVIFNNMLKSTRNPIKCAFGRFKARWSFLSKRVDLQLTFVSTAIFCFVLHWELTFCAVDQELVKKQIDKHKQDQLTNAKQDTVFAGNLDESEIIRDVLLSSVNDNLI